ncbi:MAG: signal recognition particle-docking protein FtsY [Flavobacteriales bacterium]|jgi:fused signal recognition particle receptor|tara:strand:- start:9874 stop:11049 length:1176 start_codon:yes stop_codon:yes gene_type:complete
MSFFNKLFSKKKKNSDKSVFDKDSVADKSLEKSISKEVPSKEVKELIDKQTNVNLVKKAVKNKKDEIFSEPKKNNFIKKLFNKEKKESLNKGLKISSESFFSKISKAIVGKSKVDEEVLDELEEILISSDVGVKTTLKIIDRIENRVAKDKYINTNELDLILKEEITAIIKNSDEIIENFTIINDKKPHVILVVGVNGAGKTTSIGKMASYYKSLGLKVVIGAADTFRAAAIEQLEVWANRVKVDLIKQEMGSDPASVAFDTLESAIKKDADVVLIDTAGRLHNKANLMNELGKIKRVLKKKNSDTPHEVILVIDGSTGQNAFEQAKQFTKVTEITSLLVTKLDGTAKGGVVLGISDQFQIPIKFIGIGEKIEDLQIFDKKEFVDSFFKKS